MAPGEPSAPIPSAGCSSTTTPTGGRTSISFDSAGGRRFSLVTAPEQIAAGVPMPLLLSLHPFVLDPEAWEAYSGLAAGAAQRGYLTVSPRGSDPGPRWSVPGGLPGGPDDLAFISDLVDRMESTYCVDTSRVFAAGFSAGAAMSVAIGCQMGARFAAIAASGGSNLTSLCPDAAPIDSLILHGTADPIAPINGSQIIFAPPLGLPVADVVASAAERAGCDATPATSRFGRTIIRSRYQHCTTGRRVEYWQMDGFGHTWAGASPVLDAVGGGTDTEISATTTVLDFFDTAR